MRAAGWLAVVFLSLLAADVHAQADQSKCTPPEVKPQPVENNYHGEKVVDPYRWLEDASSEETQRYVMAQHAYTRCMLDQIPNRQAIQAKLTEYLQIGDIDAPLRKGDYLFYTKRGAKENQPILYVRKGDDGKDRALVNVNELAPDGTVALDWWYPSDDGKYVAYGTSPNGTEVSTLQVVRTKTGELLPEKILSGRGTSIAWLPDNSGFYYSKFPKKGSVAEGQEVYFRKIFFHLLTAEVKEGPERENGDGEKDKVVFGEGRNPQDWPSVAVHGEGRWMIVSVYQGPSKNELYLKDLYKVNGEFVRLTAGENFIYDAEIFRDHIYIRTNEESPRYRVFKVSALTPAREHWRQIVPQSEGARGAVLKDIHVYGEKIVALYENKVAAQLRAFDLDGKPLHEVPLPTIGSIDAIEGDADERTAYFRFESYAVPPTIYAYDTKTGKTREWARVEAPVDPSAYEVSQVWFKSKDGVEVPMFLVHKKGLKRDGKTPVLLSGYGGFNSSRSPIFKRTNYNHLLWLNAGGIYADVNLRGGSEFGEEWHRGGMLEKKQNSFNDFIAAAEHLTGEKYTDRDHLAIEGRSNGGLLTAAAIVQRPELFGAAWIGVPLTDMLRYQNFLIARLWIPEYGSSDDPHQFRYLRAYSPYHNIKPKTHYPATIITTGETDTRVDPLHSRKFAAALQAAATNGPEDPIVLRIDLKAGHGQGKPIGKQIEEATDIWSFLFWQLGMQP